jgi:hypothetical protein
MESVAEPVTAGYYRSSSAMAWAPASYRVKPGFLDVMPAQVAQASLVPVERLPLTSIVSLGETAPPENGLMTVNAVLADGRSFDAAVPSDFVDAWCRALEVAAAAPQRTVPVPPPMPPAMVATSPSVPIAVPAAAATVAASAWGASNQLSSNQPSSLVGASPAGVATAPAHSSPARRGRLLGAVAIASVFALIVTSAILWSRSASESARAEVAEVNLQRTTDRVKELTTELDAANATLTTTKRDLDARTTELTASKAENADLTTRVGELGNEKAQVQDERNAAQELSRLGAEAAAGMADCRDRLLDIIGYVLDEFYIVASAALDVATPICQSANSAVAAFQAAAG